jgi:hypothetical protein
MFDKGLNRIAFGVNKIQRFGLRPCLWSGMAISRAVTWGSARVSYSAFYRFD